MQGVHKSGFTLVELIVVIAIIAILAAVVAPNAYKAVEKAKITKAISDFRVIRTGALTLQADTGKWPNGGNSAYRVISSELMTNYRNWTNWNGPYLERFRGSTPWRGTYYFTTNANLGRGANWELSVEFEDACFGGVGGSTCTTPDASALKLDAQLDDGNLSSGEVQKMSSGGWTDMHWGMVWDVCPTNGCTWD